MKFSLHHADEQWSNKFGLAIRAMFLRYAIRPRSRFLHMYYVVKLCKHRNLYNLMQLPSFSLEQSPLVNASVPLPAQFLAETLT